MRDNELVHLFILKLDFKPQRRNMTTKMGLFLENF